MEKDDGEDDMHYCSIVFAVIFYTAVRAAVPV